MTPQQNIFIPITLAQELRGALEAALVKAQDDPSLYRQLVGARERLDENCLESAGKSDTMKLRRKLRNVRAELDQVLNELS